MVNGEPRHRRTQAERSATTRAALVASARALFAERGFAGAAREDIVEAAGVTRGAMYHHFASKEALFQAVFEQVEDEVLATVGAAAMGADDPVEQLRLGCRAYLDAALDPAMSRICIIEAPAVLPAAVRAEIGERAALGMVREVLRAAMGQGRVADQPVEPLAQVLLAGVMAAAQYVATAADPSAARAEAGATLDRMLSGLEVQA